MFVIAETSMLPVSDTSAGKYSFLRIILMKSSNSIWREYRAVSEAPNGDRTNPSVSTAHFAEFFCRQSHLRVSQQNCVTRVSVVLFPEKLANYCFYSFQNYN